MILHFPPYFYSAAFITLWKASHVRTYHKPRRIFPLPILRWEVFSSSLLSSRSSQRSSSTIHQTSTICVWKPRKRFSSELSSAGEPQTTRKLVPPRNAERLLPVPLRSQQYLTKTLGGKKKMESDSISVFLAIKPDKQEGSNQQPVYET